MQDFGEQEKEQEIQRTGVSVFDPKQEIDIEVSPFQDSEEFNSLEIPFGALGTVKLNFFRLLGKELEESINASPQRDLEVFVIDENGNISTKKQNEVLRDDSYFECIAFFKPPQEIKNWQKLRCNLWLEGKKDSFSGQITTEDDDDIEDGARNIQTLNWKFSGQEKSHGLYVKNTRGILNSLRLNVTTGGEL